MRIVVVANNESGSRREFMGPDEEVVRQLLLAYPTLAASHPTGTPAELVAELNRHQVYTAAQVDGLPPFKDLDRPYLSQAGRNTAYAQALEAAKFLGGGPSRPDDIAERQAYLEADGDPVAAALAAYRLDPSLAEALQAVMAWAPLDKAEPPTLDVAKVEPFAQEGTDFAAAVGRAFAAKGVRPAHFNGVHSSGTLLATDPKDHRTYILKAGQGGEGVPAVAEVRTTEPRREAISWSVLQAYGYSKAAPECHLVLADGRELAAIAMLPTDFQGLDQFQQHDPARARRLLKLHWLDLHRWATLDFILGNADRHSGNLMVRDDQVQLIDWGSALAGPDFSPGIDNRTFTPCYLRIFAPSDWSQLPPLKKAETLPRLNSQDESSLRNWVLSLGAEPLSVILPKYGVDPAPELGRLAKLQSLCQTLPADLALNQLWCGVA